MIKVRVHRSFIQKIATNQNVLIKVLENPTVALKIEVRDFYYFLLL